METTSKRLSAAEKAERRKARYEKMKQIPDERRSPIVKYWLAHENDEQVELNMRYVLR